MGWSSPLTPLTTTHMNNENALEKLNTDQTAQILMRRTTDVAGVCKDIVMRTAVTIQGRKYVRCEGWQAIATAHGCIAGSRDVEKVDGGYRAIGEIRRISDGVLLAQAEGFVGMDETNTWAKRPEYACRAMAQTRAISRVCRAAFAHVVVLMNAGLSTVPAEEVPDGGFAQDPPFDSLPQKQPNSPPAAKESPSGEDLPETIGQIEAISIKSGKSAKGPWSKHSLKVSGEWYTTFSDTIGDAAQSAKDEGRSVRILFKLEQSGQYENRTIEHLIVLD